MNVQGEQSVSYFEGVDEWRAWQEDKLGRRKLAAYLDGVIATLHEPFVINVSAPYGTGKTFFLRNWQRQLLEEGARVVYLSACEAEVADEPAVALCSAISEQLVALEDSGSRDFFNALIVSSSPYFARLRGGIGHPEGDSEILRRLAMYSHVIEAKRGFRSGFVKFVQKLSEAEPDIRKRKVLILVDELDRCRPAYMLGIIEALKDLFLVPNVVAVLAADKDYLHRTISGFYGGDAGGEGYLRKFIDWEINLPEPSYNVFARHLYERFRINEAGVFVEGRDPFRGKDHLIEGFAFFADVCGLTLRQQHHCFSQLNIIARGYAGEEKPFGFLMGALVALRMRYGAEMRCFCFGQAPVRDLIRDIEPVAISKIGDHLRIGWSDFKARFEAWFLTHNEAAILKAEKAEIEKEIQSMLDSRVMNSRELPLKNRLAYLDAVLKTSEQFSKDSAFGVDASPALHVYRDIERGMFIADAP